MEERGSTPESGQMPSRSRTSWHWLIVKNTVSEMKVFTMEVFTMEVGGSVRALPVFGSEDTAIRMLPASGGWRVRRTCCGELISILCGPCSDAELVAIDPSPDLVKEGMVGRLSESSEHFLQMLLGRGGFWSYDSLAGRAPRSKSLRSLGARRSARASYDFS